MRAPSSVSTLAAAARILHAVRRGFRQGVGALGLVLTVVSTAQAQIEVENIEVFLRPDSAGRVGIVTVRNLAESAVSLAVEIMDWDRDLNGLNQFLPLGTGRGTCGGTISAFPTALRIEGRSTAQMRVTLDERAPSTPCWGIIWLSTAPQGMADSGSVRMEFVIRTGVKVYVEPRGLSRALEIDSVEARPDTVIRDANNPPQRGAVVAYLRSTGQLQVRAKGVLQVRRADNSMAGQTVVAEFPVLPDASRRLVVPLPRLAAGRYVGLLLLDFGGAETLAAQVEIEVPPERR